MNKFKINVFVISIVPLFVLTSCSHVENNSNVITSTFYNVYDNLISLGLIPNYSNIASKEKQWMVFEYIKKYTDLSKTKFSQISTSISEPNLNLLSKLNTDTLVLNEWDRINESKYLDRNIAARNIAYTSMGDSEAGRDKKRFNKWGLNFKSGFASWSNALKMLSIDLDKRYKQFNPNFDSYLSIANYIEEKNDKRLSYIKNQVNSKNEFKTNNGTMKTIGIISGLSGNSGIGLPPEEKSKISKIFSPFIYPQLYSPDFGLGFEFANIANKSESHNYVEPSATIKSIDNGSFKEVYQKQFDYLLFMKSPNQDQIEAEKIIMSLSSLLKDPSKSNENRIQIINYEDWYPTTWGAIGNFHLISKIIEVLNLLEPNVKITDKENSLNLWPFKKEELVINPSKK